MNEDLDRVHLSKVAHDGFAALLQSLHEAGASEQEALTLVLGLTQLNLQVGNYPSPINYPSSWVEVTQLLN